MAYVAIFDRGVDGKLVPVMTTSNPAIVKVIQRLVSRELFQAAYAKPSEGRKRRREASHS